MMDPKIYTVFVWFKKVVQNSARLKNFSTATIRIYINVKSCLVMRKLKPQFLMRKLKERDLPYHIKY